MPFVIVSAPNGISLLISMAIPLVLVIYTYGALTGGVTVGGVVYFFVALVL